MKPAVLLACLVLLVPAGGPCAADMLPWAGEPVANTWDEAFARLAPIPSKPAVKQELKGKVVTGYQGWFAAEGDGSGMGWKHYGGKNLGPGNCTFDLWPDLTELTDGERYPTRFPGAGGKPEPLFSSYHPETVARHFRWMKEYGIDGAMLQRFGTELRSPRAYDFNTAVMRNVRLGAEANGRSWAVMYDLSGMKEGEVMRVIPEDWKRLVSRAGILEDGGYLHHGGKPLVAVWGVGFGDGRAYSLAECAELASFFRKEGMAVMFGVPYYWKDGSRDAVADSGLHEVLRQADVLSPWSVGRYKGAGAVAKNLPARLAGDLEWTRENRISYLPVVFPGSVGGISKRPAAARLRWARSRGRRVRFSGSRRRRRSGRERR